MADRLGVEYIASIDEICMTSSLQKMVMVGLLEKAARYYNTSLEGTALVCIRCAFDNEQHTRFQHESDDQPDRCQQSEHQLQLRWGAETSATEYGNWSNRDGSL